MKTILTILLTSISFLSLAQNSSDLNIQDLDIPSAPGFILLDQAPTLIEKPATAKAFGLNILNSLAQNQGLPKNYAVEFTPFWYVPHPKMTALNYLGYNKEKNKQKPFNQARMFTVSFAYVNSSDTVERNNISLGLRANLISIRSKKAIDSLLNTNRVVRKHLISCQQKVISKGVELGLDPVLDQAAYQQMELKVLAECASDTAFIVAENRLITAKNMKPVFALDAATAYNYTFTNQTFSTGQFNRFGAWLTANYAQPIGNKQSNYINIYVVGRYMIDATLQTSGEFANIGYSDFGGKAELEFNKLSFGYEYILRMGNGTSTFRSSGSIKYKINDNLFLSGAFGKNFGDQSNLITFLGVNWGLNSGNEKVTIDK